MKFVFALIATLGFAATSNAIVAKTVKNYSCGPLLFKGTSPVGALFYSVVVKSGGGSSLNTYNPRSASPHSTPLVVKHRTMENTVYSAGDIEVTIGHLPRGGSIVTIAKASNTEWAATCVDQAKLIGGK